MARMQCNDDSNLYVGSPFARATVCDVVPYAPLHERRAQGAFNTTFRDPSSRGKETVTFSSNVARQDDNESHANTNDVTVHEYTDPPAKGAEHRNTILPDYEKNLFELESANQPCYCPCHDSRFNNSQAAPQIEQELTPLERWNAEHPSEGSTVSHWQHRSNLSPCRACSCADTADDSSDDDMIRE